MTAEEGLSQEQLSCQLKALNQSAQPAQNKNVEEAPASTNETDDVDSSKGPASNTTADERGGMQDG